MWPFNARRSRTAEQPTQAKSRWSALTSLRVLRLKSPYKDGTTHVVMLPLEFMQRLAALVPRPRLHLIRFHGALAPNAKLRSAIVPQPAENESVLAANHTDTPGPAAPGR